MKHFIHLGDLSKQEITHIFELAYRIKEDAGIVRPLYGKTIVLFFPESSIRTRVSFEKGIQMLGGHTVLFPPSALDKKGKKHQNWWDIILPSVVRKDMKLTGQAYAMI